MALGGWTYHTGTPNLWNFCTTLGRSVTQPIILLSTSGVGDMHPGLLIM
jgi:hypothetical protein